jgi:hypothetical protein
MAKFGAIALDILAPAAIGGRFVAALKVPPAARRRAYWAPSSPACMCAGKERTTGESSNRIEKELHRERA